MGTIGKIKSSNSGIPLRDRRWANGQTRRGGSGVGGSPCRQAPGKRAPGGGHSGSCRPPPPRGGAAWVGGRGGGRVVFVALLFPRRLDAAGGRVRRSAPAEDGCSLLGASLALAVGARHAGRAAFAVSVSRSAVHSIVTQRLWFGVCHLEGHAPGTPRMRFAPARRYFADCARLGGDPPGTPRCASRRRGGTSPAVLARGGRPPGTPRCAPRPDSGSPRHTGRTPGLKAPVLARGATPRNPRCASRPRGGTSPTHRPLAGHGPGSLGR